MLTLVYTLILGGYVAAGTAHVGQWLPPPGARMEKGSTVARTRRGAVRWMNEWTMEKVTVGGQPMVRFTETGDGTYAPFRERVQWNIEALWVAATAFRPLRLERTVSNIGGAILQHERKFFDLEKGTVQFEREDRDAKNSIRTTMSVPPDTLALEGIAGALRSLPFDRLTPVDSHILSNEPKLYDASFEFRGRERIATPIGKLDCYKVELVPRLGVLSVFRPFLPKAYFWFTAEPPHIWIRYEGPESGPGSPDVILEIRNYEKSD
jgi:hypothetical protein